MTTTSGIKSPQLLEFAGDGNRIYYGASQYWYGTSLQRTAGCGPTTAAHLLYYLSRTRRHCAPLAPYDCGNREGFVQMMEESWRSVTPGMMGVHSTGDFSKKIECYGKKHGVELEAVSMDISRQRAKRPKALELFGFLCESFDKDLPIAFLNLDNGSLSQLERWHWVTLVSCDPESGSAVMFDQGGRYRLDLALWLKTTRLGGGFVAAQPK